MQLRDRVALLIGAGRMGPAIGAALAARGVDVAASFHHRDTAADDVAAAVRSAGRRAMTLPCDVTGDEASIAAAVARVADTLGRLDVLVVMASRYDLVPFEALTTESLDQQLGVDMRGTFACIRAVVPHMRAVGGGRIITCSDWTVVEGRPRYPGRAGYYIAKAGVKAVTEACALELAGDGILVNSIAPGPMVPPDAMDAATRARVERATPLGRWGGGDAIAQAVVALAETDFITGETIRVDGGRHLR